MVEDNSDIGSRNGLTVHHVLCRTVRDSAFSLDMIRLHQPGAFPLPSVQQGLADACQQVPKSLRIALQIEHPFGESIDPECLHAATTMAKLCESLGHQIEELNTFPDYRAAARAMNKILCAHTFQQIKAVLRRSDISMEQAELEISTRQVAEVGSRITAIDYIEAIVTLDRISEQMKNLFGPVSLILSPVLAKTTARLGWLNMNAVNLEEYAARYRSYSGFAPLANGAGLPSLSIPSIRASGGSNVYRPLGKRSGSAAAGPSD